VAKRASRPRRALGRGAAPVGEALDHQRTGSVESRRYRAYLQCRGASRPGLARGCASRPRCLPLQRRRRTRPLAGARNSARPLGARGSSAVSPRWSGPRRARFPTAKPSHTTSPYAARPPATPPDAEAEGGSAARRPPGALAALVAPQDRMAQILRLQKRVRPLPASSSTGPCECTMAAQMGVEAPSSRGARPAGLSLGHQARRRGILRSRRRAAMRGRYA
jgi:hypothetical protein